MMSPNLKDAMLYTLYRHMLEKNHSIDEKNALFVFNDKNKVVLQNVVVLQSRSCLTSGFYNFPDNIAHDIVSELYIQLSFLVL